jgi:anti-sigma regulatory factor (Ser/Thr protein kinase)
VDRTALEDDEIRLHVPAQPEFARVARVAAGGLAARLGFTYDEVEELRLAIGEAWALVLGSEQADGTVELRFRVGLHSLAVEFTASVSGPPTPAAVAPAADPVDVLQRITDGLQVDTDRRWLRFDKVQRS